jgi:hypothetical protein
MYSGEFIKGQEFTGVPESLKRKAEALAMVMGGFGVNVRFGPPGSGYYWDFQHDCMNFDLGLMATEGEEVTLGAAMHEGGHRYCTRPEHFQDIWKETGASYLINCWEDPAANMGVMNMLPGARPNIQAYIEKDLGPDGGLNYLKINSQTQTKMGYVPKFMQYGSEIIRYWHEREFSGSVKSTKEKAAFEKFLDAIPDKEVKEAVSQTAEAFEEYYDSVPKNGTRDENNIQDAARKRADVFKTKGWDICKKLVEKSEKDQSLVNMLQEMLKDMKNKQQASQQGAGQPGQGQPGGKSGKEGKQKQGQTTGGSGGGGSTEAEQPGSESTGGGGAEPLKFEDLPKEIQQEIQQLMQDIEEKKREAQTKQGGKDQPQTSSSEGDQKEKTQGDKEQGTGGKDEVQKTESQEGKEGEQGEKPNESKEAGELWQEMNEEAKKKVEEFYDKSGKVSEEKKKELEAKSKEEIENSEDSANEKLRGMMNNKQQTETHKEKKEREAQKARNEQMSKSLQNAAQSLEGSAKETISALQSTLYGDHKAKDEVVSTITYLTNNLLPKFRPTGGGKETHEEVGFEADLDQVRAHKADKRVMDLYVESDVLDKRNYRFTFLVDLSGSMRDDGKIEKVVDMLVALNEVLSTIEIDYEIIGFSGNFATGSPPQYHKIYKSFDQNMLTNADTIMQSIADLEQECQGNTPTYEATQAAYDRLVERDSTAPAPYNFLITLTDGDCNSCDKPTMLNKILELSRSQERQNIFLSGLGIGQNTDFVNEIYPLLPESTRVRIMNELGISLEEVGNSYPDLDAFVKAFTIIIQDMIDNPTSFKI